MKTHNLQHLTMSDAYDTTQTNAEICDGDILLVRDGVAIMVEAWPVMAEGISAVFHNVSHGFHAETSEKYAAAFAAAAALKSAKPEKRIMSDQLLSQFDQLETQLVEIYNAIGEEMSARAFDQNDADRATLLEQRQNVKGLLHNVRDTLRTAAPELYTDF